MTRPNLGLVLQSNLSFVPGCFLRPYAQSEGCSQTRSKNGTRVCPMNTRCPNIGYNDSPTAFECLPEPSPHYLDPRRAFNFLETPGRCAGSPSTLKSNFPVWKPSLLDSQSHNRISSPLTFYTLVSPSHISSRWYPTLTRELGDRYLHSDVIFSPPSFQMLFLASTS